MNSPDIAALEDRRYAAMKAGDITALRDLLSSRLRYTHSLGEQDTLESYLDKVSSRHFVYHAIDHPIDWMEQLPGAVLLAGRMAAEVDVQGQRRRISNAFLAVWADEGDAWRLIAYQPTPLRDANPHKD